jgi:OmpA-OmpF porin, OOP family
MKYRSGWLALLMMAMAAAVMPAHAQDEEEEVTDNRALKGRPAYMSLMGSYSFADKDRGTRDGLGAQIAVGKKVTRGMTLEFTGFLNNFNPEVGFDPAFELKGVGLGAMIFPWNNSPNLYALLSVAHGTGENLPGAIPDYRTTVFDSGLGYLLPITSRMILRTEARYRMDAHNRKQAGVQTPPQNNKHFYDGVLNIGLLFPLGVPAKPEEPAVMDSDGDGVPDDVDECPGTPAGAIVDARGCELDSDGDGVPDRIDQCPDTPIGQAVDEVGCPLTNDGDGDGVLDDVDECPNTPAGAKVLANGCSLVDDCRTPGPGEQVDANGCAIGFVLKGVKFEFNADRLTRRAQEILDQVAETLLAYPDVRVEIGGHTDSLGRDAYNLALSERRARSARQYLIGRGVDAGRMTAVGYGEARPIADNETPEGQEENRRVELKVLE